MGTLTRITLDPAVMGGKTCIRGLRVTVGTVVGLLAAGRSPDDILKAYPWLEREDIDEALAYAAGGSRSGKFRWHAHERNLLVDMNLSPDWVPILNDHGWPAIHCARQGNGGDGLCARERIARIGRRRPAARHRPLLDQVDDRRLGG